MIAVRVESTIFVIILFFCGLNAIESDDLLALQAIAQSIQNLPADWYQPILLENACNLTGVTCVSSTDLRMYEGYVVKIFVI